MKAPAGRTLGMCQTVSKLPSVRGVVAVVEHGKGETEELGTILRSIQRRVETVGASVAELKNGL